jgi:AraC-like DNA-binding protein
MRIDYELLREAIYGGHRAGVPKPETLLGGQSIGCPCSVMAFEVCVGAKVDTRALSEAPGRWVIDLSDGMVYVTFTGKAEPILEWAENQSVLSSDAFTCYEADEWLNRLQNAIVSIRGQYISRDHITASFDVEQEISERARSAIRHNIDWQHDARDWTALCIARNHVALNNCRRKIIQFITRLCDHVDINNTLSFLLRQSLQRIQQTYALSHLPDVVMDVIAELHPYVFQPAGTRVPGMIERAIAFIQDHYRGDVSLKTVAKGCHISHEHLCRQFKEHTGYTTSDYIQRLRIDHAKELLSTTTLGVLDIAEASGFNNVEHFHRVFKKRTHTSPHRYRKRR